MLCNNSRKLKKRAKGGMKTGAVWPGWQSGDLPGAQIFEVKKKLLVLFAKVRGDNLHKLKYYSNNQGPCLIKEHL